MVKQSTSEVVFSDEEEAFACPAKCENCTEREGEFACRFSELTLDKETHVDHLHDPGSHMLFVRNGHLQVEGKYGPAQLIGGDFCFFVAGEATSIRALAKTNLVRLDFTLRVMFCGRDYFSNLCRHITVDGYLRKPPVARMPEILWPVLNFVFIDRKLTGCPYFHRLHLIEVMMIIDHTCSIETKQQLFASVARVKDDFKVFVLTRYMDVRTVEQFAQLAQMSKSAFKKKFEEIFHMPVAAWRVKQIAAAMAAYIREGNGNIQELRERFGLDNDARFYRFCNTQFGVKPQELIAFLQQSN